MKLLANTVASATCGYLHLNKLKLYRNKSSITIKFSITLVTTG